MARILLLHTNESYADTLARSVSAIHPEHEVTPVSRVPVRERLRALVGKNFDLIQTDELLVNGVLAAGASVAFDVPLVVAIRGWADYTNAHGQYGRLREASIRARSRLVLRQASETIFISKVASEIFREQFSVKRSSVIRRPIDVGRYSSGTKTEHGTLNILTVTNLRYQEKYRGVLTILRALSPLFEEHADLRYRIAGGGQYLNDLRDYLDRYEFADRVTILGFVEAIEDELASADVFAYVSFLDSYATTVVEAQAAGLPVVGGDAMGVPEAVGDAGEICEPTPEALRDTLERIIVDDAYRRSLATESRRKMATYNESSAAAHVEVWERVLGE